MSGLRYVQGLEVDRVLVCRWVPSLVMHGVDDMHMMLLLLMLLMLGLSLVVGRH